MKKRLKSSFPAFIVFSILLVLIVALILNQKFLFPEKVSEDNQSVVPNITLASSAPESPTPSPKILASPSPKPTLKPIPTPTAKTTNLDDLFAKYGSKYGVDVGLLKKIAGCESGFDPNQVTGDYAGLFQFGSQAWIDARGRIGLDNNQILRFNAEESIKTAAFEINYKGTSGWSDCD